MTPTIIIALSAQVVAIAVFIIRLEGKIKSNTDKIFNLKENMVDLRNLAVQSAEKEHERLQKNIDHITEKQLQFESKEDTKWTEFEARLSNIEKILVKIETTLEKKNN